MVDFMIAGILLVILGAAIIYIVKAKKSGVKCIGCPDSVSCGHGQSGAGGSGNCGGNCVSCRGNCEGSCSDAREKTN